MKNHGNAHLNHLELLQAFRLFHTELGQTRGEPFCGPWSGAGRRQEEERRQRTGGRLGEPRQAAGSRAGRDVFQEAGREPRRAGVGGAR